MKTVYVIGAGASYELGLPLGKDLKNLIAGRLSINKNGSPSGDEDIRAVMQSEVNADGVLLSQYIDQANFVAQNLPAAISIDNFIDAHRGNEQIEKLGKLAIVRSIIEAESKTELSKSIKRDKRFTYGGKDYSYLNSLFQSITENCDKEDLKQRFEGITFIIFNYDRCVEFFLAGAVKEYYGLTIAETSEIVSRITFIHPYGQVGYLPWQESEENNVVEFGSSQPDIRKLPSLAESIKTFTQGCDDETLHQISEALRQAKNLVFLGFAYHTLNMMLFNKLGRERINNPHVKVLGTAYGRGPADIEAIRSSIISIFGREPTNGVTIVEETCTDLFARYSTYLSYPMVPRDH